MSAADLKTPLKRARGLGSAKSGVHHWVVQRVTAVALIPLSLWVIWLVLVVLHADYAHARGLVHEPLNAVLLTAFVLTVFWHTQLGLQVVIEDYVHTSWAEVFAQLAVKFFCALGALACVFAIAKIALA